MSGRRLTLLLLGVLLTGALRAGTCSGAPQAASVGDERSAGRTDTLRRRLEALTGGFDATVGIAVLTDRGEAAALHGDSMLPMMSLFKVHVALAVLDRMAREGAPLDAPIAVAADDLLPDTYSPLRDRIGRRDTLLPLSELLRCSVALSDNNACDILLRYAGGPQAVARYVRGLGAGPAEISATEAQMHEHIDLQRANRTSPRAMAQLLRRLALRPPVGAPYADFLLGTLRATTTGADKLAAGLPADAVLAHKTGSSDRTPQGVKIADNDAGIVTLPDGRRYYLAVFVVDSHADDRYNAALIAAVARCVHAWMTGE